MHNELVPLLTIAWAVGFGLLAQVLAHRWHVPAIVLLLLFGVLLGPTVLGIVEPASLGDGLSILVKLAIAVILFEGALNLRLKTLRLTTREVRNLVTVGVLITWGLTALIAHYVARFDWAVAILFGALMTVTGPTVIQPLMGRISVPRNVKTILEGEAILVDPIGAILAVAVLDVILGISAQQSVGVLSALWGYFGRLVIGGLTGALVAVILSRLLKVPRLIPSELSNLVVLASVWVAFGLAEMVQGEAGIMASVVMGLVLQREAVPGERQLRLFKESLTTLSISVLFILLAADLHADAILAEGAFGVLAVLLIMLVARPASVFLSTWRTNLDWREKTFIAWIGPRGIIAASVASLFALTLHEVGITGGERLQALAFLAIIMTVTIQGLTGGYLARVLSLHSMEGHQAVVVGAGCLGRAVASILLQYGRPVVLVDTNHLQIDDARQMGFETIHGNALDEEVLEQAHLDEAETLIATTSNSEVNVLVSQIAHEVFGVLRTFPVLINPEKGAGTRLLEQTGGKLAFGRVIDVQGWEYTCMQVRPLSWQVPQSWSDVLIGYVQFPNDLLPVLRIRDKSAEVVHADQVWRPGDKVVFLINTSSEQAQQQLDSLYDRMQGVLQTDGVG